MLPMIRRPICSARSTPSSVAVEMVVVTPPPAAAAWSTRWAWKAGVSMLAMSWPTTSTTSAAACIPLSALRFTDVASAGAAPGVRAARSRSANGRPGMLERGPDLVVGDGVERAVPGADRAEVGRHQRADDGVSFGGQQRARVGAADRRGGHDRRRAAVAQREDRGAHRGAGRQAVVDDGHGAAGDV